MWIVNGVPSQIHQVWRKLLRREVTQLTNKAHDMKYKPFHILYTSK